MSDSYFQIRMYKPSDYEMISKWWEAHGRPPCPQEMLPKLGVVVQMFGAGEPCDVAAMWLYMDNSVGVCFLEKAVTSPGLKLSVARDALFEGIKFLKEAAAGMDYGIMLLRTYPSLARYAERIGFFPDDKQCLCMMALTREET